MFKISLLTLPHNSYSNMQMKSSIFIALINVRSKGQKPVPKVLKVSKDVGESICKGRRSPVIWECVPRVMNV